MEIEPNHCSAACSSACSLGSLAPLAGRNALFLFECSDGTRIAEFIRMQVKAWFQFSALRVASGALLLLMVLGACSQEEPRDPSLAIPPDATTGDGSTQSQDDISADLSNDAGVDGEDAGTEWPEWLEDECSSHDDCGDHEEIGYCYKVGDAPGYCTVVCQTECPPGYGCVAVTNAGDSDTLFLCVKTYECELSDTKECSANNEYGSCVGVQNCGNDGKWGNCDAKTPSQEICDGEDNDCDLVVDEDLDVGGDCSVDNEFGSCAGTSSCQGVAGVVCDGPVPAQEECDGLDNNCDNVVDEGFTDTDSDGQADCVDNDDDNDGIEDDKDCKPLDANAPSCEGKQCGSNGCGVSCGDCAANQNCQENQCVCVPDCNGKQCGSDGCGSTCGTCPENNQCNGNQCVTDLLGFDRYWCADFGNNNPNAYPLPGSGDHLYTANPQSENLSCYVLEAEDYFYMFSPAKAPAGSIPIYRYWNHVIGNHFYTKNGALGIGNYQNQGVIGYAWGSPGPNRVPIYRYFSPDPAGTVWASQNNSNGFGDHIYMKIFAGSTIGDGPKAWKSNGKVVWYSPTP